MKREPERELTSWNRFRSEQRAEAERVIILDRIRKSELEILELAENGAFTGNEGRMLKMIEGMMCDTNAYLRCK